MIMPSSREHSKKLYYRNCYEINEMKNITIVENCYGCGVCAVSCGKQIIKISLDKDGFYAPYVLDESKCTNCGICTDVCAFLHKDLALGDINEHSYAAWSKDSTVRRSCSSGGVSFEVGKYLLKKGYKVCGVRYNPDRNRAEHYVSENIDELLHSVGSKYMQSYTFDAFKSINRKDKYLVTGTPCQIDSFRRYIKKFRCEDNFVLLDFFCHGVPSMLLWKKYTKCAEKHVGKITGVSWRNKWSGVENTGINTKNDDSFVEKINWHDSYDMKVFGKNGMIESRSSNGDMFYALFWGDYCLGKHCYNSCKYKSGNSSADIRVGDFWGELYKDNDEGVSCAIAFTDKGMEVLKNSNCELKEHPFEIVTEGQLKENIKFPQKLHAVLLSLLNISFIPLYFVAIISRACNKFKIFK